VQFGELRMELLILVTSDNYPIVYFILVLYLIGVAEGGKGAFTKATKPLYSIKTERGTPR
jgi:hypothetical protein